MLTKTMILGHMPVRRMPRFSSHVNQVASTPEIAPDSPVKLQAAGAGETQVSISLDGKEHRVFVRGEETAHRFALVLDAVISPDPVTALRLRFQNPDRRRSILREVQESMGREVVSDTILAV